MYLFHMEQVGRMVTLFHVKLILSVPHGTKRKEHAVLHVLFFLFQPKSGSGESNPGRTVPNRVHYHYATPRLKQKEI